MHALLTEREKYIYIMFCKACVKATETEEQRERKRDLFTTNRY